jgi:hypothetical protein
MRVFTPLASVKTVATVYILIGCLALIGLVPSGAFAASNASVCREIFEDGSKFLTPMTSGVDFQTVFFDRVEDDAVVLIKREVGDWNSSRILVPQGFTVQGDPRAPFFFFGQQLARQLGFKIQRGVGRLIELHAPRAKKLENTVEQLNPILESHGHEPIGFLPVYSGFLRAREAFTLASEPTGQILIRFAYGDDLPELTPHEIAYHLNALLYPHWYLERASQVGQQTRDFINYLESRNLELGPVTGKIVSQLILERNQEVDTGIADVPAFFLGVRSYHPDQDYKTIWSKFSKGERVFTILKPVVERFVRPSLSPLEALLVRLFHLTGGKIDLSTAESINENVFLTKVIRRSRSLLTYLNAEKKESRFSNRKNFANFSDKQMGIGKEIHLTLAETLKLNAIVEDYIRIHQADSFTGGIGTSEEWLSRLILSFDERIAQLSSALTELENKSAK